jgi:hypothetical protein
METYGLYPLASLDDDEAAVAALSDDERAELLVFAAEWDAEVAAARDEADAHPTVPIPWIVLVPIALASIIVLVFTWVIW